MPDRKSNRPSRSHASPEQRRTQILDAALECFAARGFHATTMDDIVRTSGLSKGSLYWHFDSKLAVFLGVFDAFAGRLVEEWERIEGEETNSLAALRRQSLAAIDVIASEPVLLGAWAEFLTHPEARQRMAGIYTWTRDRSAEVIARGVECGDVRPGAAAGAPATLTALVEGLLLQTMMDPGFDARAHFADAWDVARRGLEA